MVKKILDIISFEKVWADFHLYQFFKHTSETMIEVKALFDEEVYLHGWVSWQSSKTMENLWLHALYNKLSSLVLSA